MKFLSILAAVCAFGLCSCATLHQRDRNLLQEHGVAGPLYEKMLHQEPVSLSDIIELSHRQLPVPFIIHYLAGTYFVYNLRSDDVLQLKRAGISREIMDYLLSTPGQFSPQAVPLWYPYAPYDYGYYGPSAYYYSRGHSRHW